MDRSNSDDYSLEIIDNHNQANDKFSNRESTQLGDIQKVIATGSNSVITSSDVKLKEHLILHELH